MAAYNTLVGITFCLIIMLISLMIVLVCKTIMFSNKAQDPEKVLLVQDQYKQVYN